MVPNLLLLGILCINLTFLQFGDIKISVLHGIFLFVVGFVIFRVKRIKLSKAITMVVLLILPFISIYFVRDTLEFFKTLFTYTTLVLCYFCVLPYLQKSKEIEFFTFYKRILTLIFFLQCFGIIQWFFANYLDSFSLYNFYPSWQFHEEQLIGTYNGISRASSIFSEPSIFAMFCNLSCALILAFNRLKKNWGYFIVNIVSLVITFSSSGYLFFVLMLIIFICLQKNYYLIGLVSGALLIAILLYSPQMFEVFRFAELGTPGSSGYYRIVSPLLMLKDILSHYPATGIGIGQIDLILPEYSRYFKKSGGVGDTLDNSFMLSIIVFGLPILFIYYLVIKKYIQRYLHQKRNVILIIYLVYFINMTGLLFAPEFILIILICEWALYQNAVKPIMAENDAKAGGELLSIRYPRYQS